MKLHDYLKDLDESVNIRLYNSDGDLLFLGDVKQIIESIMFENWVVDSVRCESNSFHIWIS